VPVTGALVVLLYAFAAVNAVIWLLLTAGVLPMNNAAMAEVSPPEKMVYLALALAAVALARTIK
jgi:hypothetical protein